MRDVILRKLTEIEQAEKITILLAVESGSRAWGFASPDSDFDVRFIYTRRKQDYLKLEETRDVIETPISDDLDINGWDLQKSLRLLYKSNPTVIEWLSSPIVYRETAACFRLRAVLLEYFSVRNSLWHYLSMAESNYRTYLRGDMVKAKKYFYVLRPLLACRWILEHETPPPMLFSELTASQLPRELLPEVERLLRLKSDSPEISEIPRILQINEYLDRSISDIKECISGLPKEPIRNWSTLDKLFLEVLGEQNA